MQYLNSTKSLLNVTATAVAARALAEWGKEIKALLRARKRKEVQFYVSK